MQNLEAEELQEQKKTSVSQEFKIQKLENVQVMSFPGNGILVYCKRCQYILLYCMIFVVVCSIVCSMNGSQFYNGFDMIKMPLKWLAI